MTTPLVSICIPTYNQVYYLEKNLNSILHQSFKNFEIVVTDDSTTCDVEVLINKYNDKLPIRFFKNKKSLGTPENWNEAISKAKGEFIKVMHHDDWFTRKDSLQVFVDTLQNSPKQSFVFSGVEINNSTTNEKRSYLPTIQQIEKLKAQPSNIFLTGNLIGPPSSQIYRKSEIKFDTNLIWFVDIEFYMRFLKKENELIYINDTLVASPENVPHQVTNDCLENLPLQFKEIAYIYWKYSHSNTIRKNLYKLYLNTIRKNKVKNIKATTKGTIKKIRSPRANLISLYYKHLWLQKVVNATMLR